MLICDDQNLARRRDLCAGSLIQKQWLGRGREMLRLANMTSSMRPPAIVVALLATVMCVAAQARAQPQELARTALAGEVELARLVDLCAQRLGLKIEYDAKTVQGAKVTLRLGEPVTDEELWALTNQLLATRGLTSIQPPGQEEVLSIVKLTDAASLARVEQVVPPETLAGFANVVVQIEHRSVKDVIEAMKPLLSKPGGTMTALGDDGRILLSALRPRINQILWLLESFDLPGAETIIRVIPSQYVNATQLASSVTAAVTARNTMSIRPRQLAGKLSPQSGDESVVLVAPEDELQTWLELLGQFDRRQAVETRSYTPRHFALDEVEQLIEQTARDLGPRGSGGQWRLVTNDLTGALIVTATPSEHKTIEGLIQRLDAVPAEARRPVRVFAIRNRSVNEIVDILTQLIEAGVLEGGGYEAKGNPKATTSRQQTQRAVLPPGAEPPPRSQAEPRGSGQRRVTGSSSITGEPSLVLTADEGTNTLIATGDARRLAQLEQLIGQLDVRQPQVMIEVMVVSLTEGQTLDLGVELEKLQVYGETLITLSSLFGLGPAPGIAGAVDGMALPGAGAGFTGVALNPGDFRTLVRALETLNEGRSLNIPRVLVNNNQQATLDSVLQAPFLSTNASDTIATTSFGGTQDAGTTVTVTPQIAAGDHLILEYAVSLSTFVGESSDPGLPPPRQQSNLQSVVTIPDGYTIAVGGMEIESSAEAISQIPLLGDIPLIGEVFKNRSRSTTRSRFFVFIRANVLRHDGFEDLKYLSDRDVLVAGVDDGWPVVEPRVIH